MRIFLGSMAVAAFLCSNLSAATYTWNPATGASPNGGSGNFSTAGSWTPSGAPTGTDPTDVLVFPNLTGFTPSGGSTITATNDIASFNLFQLQFNSNFSAYTVAGASSTFLFNSTGGSILQTGLAAATVSTNIALPSTGALAVTGNGAGVLALSGLVSGTSTGGLTINRPVPSGAAFTPGVGYTMLGNTTASNTFTGGVTLTGSTLTLNGSATVNPLGNNALTVGGTNSSLVFTAAITLGSTTLPSTMNAVTLNSTLTILGIGAATFNDSATFSGTGGLTYRSSQTATLLGYSRYTGETTIDVQPFGVTVTGFSAGITTTAGTLLLSGANGALSGTSGINVRAGGTLQLSSATALFNPDLVNNGAPTPVAAAGRLSDTAPVRLDTGRLLLSGASDATAVAETAGQLVVAGSSIVTPAPTSGTTGGVQFVFASLARPDRGVVLFRSLGLGTAGTLGAPALGVGSVYFATPPVTPGTAGTTTLPILPYAAGVANSNTVTVPTGFVTYDTTLGIRPLNTAIANGSPGAEYANFAPATAADNVRGNGGTLTVASGGTSVNSLLLVSTATTVAGTDTLTIVSGAILATGAAHVVNAPVKFGTNGEVEAILQVGNTASWGATLITTGGVTKSGAGVLTLTGTNNTTASGPLTVSGGAIVFASAANLPTITTLRIGNDSSTTAALTYSGAAGTTYTLAAPIAITGAGRFQVTNAGANWQLDGAISGTGAPYWLPGTGSTLTLSGTNTFTGAFRVAGGILSIASDANLGDPTAVLNLEATTLALTGNWTTTRPIQVSGATTLDTATNTATITGSVFGASAITKAGSGTLNWNSTASPYTGVVTVNGGTLSVNGILANSNTSNNAVTVNSGAILSGTGTINRPVTIAAGGILAPAGAGTIGTLTVAGATTSSNTTITGGAGTTWKIDLVAVAPNTPTTAEAGAANVDKLLLLGADVGRLNLVSTGTTPITFEINQLGGTFTAGSPVSYVIATAVNPVIRENGTQVTNGNSFTGNLAFTSTNFTASSYNLSVRGSNVVLTFTPTAVPEPFALLGIGAALLAWKRRRFF